MLNRSCNNYARYLYLVLFVNITACRHDSRLGAWLQKDTPKADKYANELDNVPRVFAIDQLKKLEALPAVSPKEGMVIGMVRKDRSIACVNEAALYEILHPLIAAHIPKIVQHIPKITATGNDFSIKGSNFQLLPSGNLLLTVDFIIADEVYHTGYLPVVLSDSATGHEGHYIVLPPNRSLASCIRHECKDGLCRFNSVTGCLCHRNSLDVRGCLTIW